MGDGDGVREVDWESMGGLDVHESSPRHSEGLLGSLLLDAQQVEEQGSAQEVIADVLRRLRERLSVARTALFVRSPNGEWLKGTVGTSLDGSLTDERGIRYRWGSCDEEAHTDWVSGKKAWTVSDDAPLIANDGNETRVAGRGWHAKTPVRGPRGAIGILHNDAGTSGRSFSELEQDMIAAYLCAVGPKIEKALQRKALSTARGASAPVRKARELLREDTSLSHSQLSERVGLSTARLSRAFQKETGGSLVDYRNAVRLELFLELVDRVEQTGATAPLLEMALKAGFGSYAQFHRVFSSALGRSPKDYLKPRG